MKSASLKRMSGQELLKHFCDTLNELRDRKLVRSTNNPAGDYAEKIVKDALHLSLAEKSNAGFDATDSRDRRYQIKGRRITPHNQSRQLSFMRELESKPFDYLVGVLFEPDFSVKRAAKIPFRIVRERARYSTHTKAHRILLVDEIWGLKGVQDVTSLVATAARQTAKESNRPDARTTE